mgnify:CR=1 FL=1
MRPTEENTSSSISTIASFISGLNFKGSDFSSVNLIWWFKSTQALNQVTGYFTESGDDSSVLAVGTSSISNLSYITSGALLKFEPTSGNHFMT